MKYLSVSSLSTKEKKGRGGKKCEASRFSTGFFRVRLVTNTRGICKNTQRYSAETLALTTIIKISNSTTQHTQITHTAYCFTCNPKTLSKNILFKSENINFILYYVRSTQPLLLELVKYASH